MEKVLIQIFFWHRQTNGQQIYENYLESLLSLPRQCILKPKFDTTSYLLKLLLLMMKDNNIGKNIE